MVYLPSAYICNKTHMIISKHRPGLLQTGQVDCHVRLTEARELLNYSLSLLLSKHVTSVAILSLLDIQFVTPKLILTNLAAGGKYSAQCQH